MRHDSENTPGRTPAQPQALRGSTSVRKAATGHHVAKHGSGNESRPAPVSAEDRHVMIATAAYYCAERRDFAPGGELEDWLVTEAEIDRQLGGS